MHFTCVFRSLCCAVICKTSGCKLLVFRLLLCSIFFGKTSGSFVAPDSSLSGNRPEAGAMLTSLSPITPPPAVSDMHYPWNYFHQTDSPSSSAAAGPLTTSGGAFSWYGSRWPSNGDLKPPFGGVAPGNYFPSYDASCFGSAPTHHQLNVAANGPTQVSQLRAN